jgi:threonine dehydrogenase-like Zn-dependent dehydrogenase
MNAIVQTAYGSSDVMEYRQVDKPEPGEGQVLVRVMATSLAAGGASRCRSGFTWGFSSPSPASS